MKKAIVVFIAVLFLGSLAVGRPVQAASEKTGKHAQKAVDVFHGKIVKIDEKNKAITIKLNKTEEEKTFTASTEILSGLKVDEEVRVKIKPGTQMATHIMPVKKHKKSGQK